MRRAFIAQGGWMNISALPTALAFTMNLTLCLVVLSSKPRDIGHRLFACFVLSFAVWNLGELILAIHILIIKNIGETVSQKAYGRSLWVESALILALVFMLRPFQTKVGDWIDRFFYNGTQRAPHG